MPLVLLQSSCNMKTTVLFFFLLSLLTQQASAQWQPQSSGVTNTLRDIAFYNTNIGYAVGDGGIVLKTINGGNKWTTISSPGKSSLVSITIIDSNAIMVTTASSNGGSAAVFESPDGGARWFKVLSDLPSFYATAISGQLYSVSSQIYNSTNMGRSWQSQQSLNPTSNFTQLAFSNPGTGIVAGNIAGILTYSADFLRTVNGHDWYRGNSFSFPNAYAFCRFSALGTDSVLMFTNRYNGFAQGDSSQLILINHFKLKNNFGTPAWFFDNTILIKSFPDVISDCQFQTGGNGYAVSEKGVVYKLTSGGQKIAKEYSSKTPLHAIYMIDNNHGFAVGDNGFILKRTRINEKVSQPVTMPLSVYPNPAVNEVQVKFSLPQSARLLVQVTNENGNILLQQSAGLFEKGNNTIPVKLGNLPRGNYRISVLNDTKEVMGTARLLLVQ